ncbi:MAG: ABC transporter [Acidobacteria bacterium]|nr:ABC transporter [Acidobacteriota bacterium]|tara:strand:+ start:772 stop:1266 length:495 start_codon:yes stop_codon:yes gene_type:complete
MGNDPDLRQHLVILLEGKGAHLTFDAVIDDWPAEARARKPHGAPHSAWQLLEHMRIAQRDILDFCVKREYVEPCFPDDYWPPGDEVPDNAAWTGSVERFAHDLEQMQQLVADSKTDLRAIIPHGTGQTVLREAFVVADHNAYHLGQLVLLRRLLGIWNSPASAL